MQEAAREIRELKDGSASSHWRMMMKQLVMEQGQDRPAGPEFSSDVLSLSSLWDTQLEKTCKLLEI